GPRALPTSALPAVRLSWARSTKASPSAPLWRRSTRWSSSTIWASAPKAPTTTSIASKRDAPCSTRPRPSRTSREATSTMTRSSSCVAIRRAAKPPPRPWSSPRNGRRSSTSPPPRREPCPRIATAEALGCAEYGAPDLNTASASEGAVPADLYDTFSKLSSVYTAFLLYGIDAFAQQSGIELSDHLNEKGLDAVKSASNQCTIEA